MRFRAGLRRMIVRCLPGPVAVGMRVSVGVRVGMIVGVAMMFSRAMRVLVGVLMRRVMVVIVIVAVAMLMAVAMSMTMDLMTGINARRLFAG